MAKNMKLSRLLQEMEKEEIIAEVLKLADKFEVVRNYFTIELSGDAAPLLQKAKAAITKQFETGAGFRNEPKASNLNRIVKNFEQLSIFKSDLAELLVHRINETIRWAMNGYYSAGNALVNSTELAMDKARKLLAEEQLEEHYAERTREWDNPNWRYGKPREWNKPQSGWWTW